VEENALATFTTSELQENGNITVNLSCLLGRKLSAGSVIYLLFILKISVKEHA
jgi:hypothetical protein